MNQELYDLVHLWAARIARQVFVYKMSMNLGALAAQRSDEVDVAKHMAKAQSALAKQNAMIGVAWVLLDTMGKSREDLSPILARYL